MGDLRVGETLTEAERACAGGHVGVVFGGPDDDLAQLGPARRRRRSRNRCSFDVVVAEHAVQRVRGRRDAGSSAVPQPGIVDPGAQVEWVPLETRSGRRDPATGPSAMSRASKTRHSERSRFMSRDDA